MNFYLVQEILGVLLVLAILMGTLLVFAIAFILFQEGMRRAVRWARTGVVVSKAPLKKPSLPVLHGNRPLTGL